MKNFKDFIATKKFMNAKKFGEQTAQDVEYEKFDGVSNVYVYMDYYYIDIYDKKNIGYDSSGKKYGLNIMNEYHESDNCRELELKLYNDFWIDCVEGNDEWLYEVGKFTPYQTSFYMRMFRDMNLNVEDITYSNDIVDTLRLSWGTMPICDVMLPNSATKDLDNEKFDTFNVCYLDVYGERYDEENSNKKTSFVEHLFETIGDLEDGLIEWFHQIARDYMEEIKEGSCFKMSEPPMSLDEFLIEYKDYLPQEDYNRGKRIFSLHENFKPLEDWYKFGCEPSNMFDSDNPIYDDEDMRSRNEMARLEQEEQDRANMSGEFEDDAKREFEECQSIVSVSKDSDIVDYQGNLSIDDNDDIVCDKCGHIVMSS